MKKYEIQINGTSPILIHGSQQVGYNETVKKKGGSAVEGDPEEWKKTIYFDESIGVYLPAINLEAAMIEAAKQFKVGARQTASKFFKSGVFIDADALPLYEDGQPVKSLDQVQVDRRTVKNPATKMRNTRYRAIFRRWSVVFQVTVSADDYITPKLFKEVLDYAGQFVGVGDFRPRFGRFNVSRLEVN